MENNEQYPNPAPAKDKSFLTKKTAAILLGTALAASSVLGYAGGLLADTFQSSGSGHGVAVMYQSAETGAAASGGSSLSVADIAGLAADSVVEIATETVQNNARRGQYVSEGAGSGVVITQDGYLVTNNHVIENAEKITVRLRNETTYSAALIGSDSQSDLALLKIDASGLQPAVFGDSDKLLVGETAVAIGNPLGELGGTVTDGIISALDREIELDGETMNLLQTNAAINPGNSGGGLFNGSGELIGIVVAKSSGSGVEGLGFAIPVNDAKTVIEQLMSNGYVKGRVTLGMTLVDVADAQTAMAYRLQQSGVYVQSVTAGSHAQTAGFQAGDCLVSADGAQITSSADLNKVLGGHQVGDELSFAVKRNNQTITLKLVLEEARPS
ncbi:peptidase S1 and S6 chymotrypsin/Hap [Syntrophobotulus glycolicus DSM 8271]|uniref:Peptidase S1 and S6 chymotrypsin/Hap n=1 Tax=Syntrophobotulus glycolicus (strain DSM 8271 / FlGlyR) TaxID=645991 RepID=F0T2K5_SYNGF|nr:trypsin-like peptidase domain-containing protein [Syntrophobotulus glycolicus]ADY55323.1 peptidase S1 and S6 chymotrypsin/Hap [Syntrophobotulus glycolicus DSM 8271]